MVKVVSHTVTVKCKIRQNFKGFWGTIFFFPFFWVNKYLTLNIVKLTHLKQFLKVYNHRFTEPYCRCTINKNLCEWLIFAVFLLFKNLMYSLFSPITFIWMQIFWCPWIGKLICFKHYRTCLNNIIVCT